MDALDYSDAGPPEPPISCSPATSSSGCWRIIRCAFALVNLIETGDAGPGILSRVFLVSAVKPEASTAEP